MAKKEFPSDKLDQYIVRFPHGMRDRIKAEAEKNNRSMNAEIIDRLERTFKPGMTLTGPEADMIMQAFKTIFDGRGIPFPTEDYPPDDSTPG